MLLSGTRLLYLSWVISASAPCVGYACAIKLKGPDILKLGSHNSYKNFDGATLESDDLRIINDILKKSDSWESGNAVAEIEYEFQQYLGFDYVYAFSHGRVAFSAILKALRLRQGDEIILPGYTCVVVPNSIIFEGLKPVYCDIELETFGPDIDSVRKVVTPRTKAIVIHHLYGLVCKYYEELIDFCNDKDIYLIEDCAQALGAVFKGKKVGRYGTAAFYSMQHSKVISTGNGGIAATNDRSLAHQLGIIQNNAVLPEDSYVVMTLCRMKELYYSNKNLMLGKLYYKYNRFRQIEFPVNIDQDEKRGVAPKNYIQRLPNALAIIGLNQLSKIEKLNSIRQKSASYWAKWAEKNRIDAPIIVDESTPVFLRYPLLLNKAEKEMLFREVIKESKVGDWMDCYLTSAIPERQPVTSFLPNATKAINSIVNLPCL